MKRQPKNWKPKIRRTVRPWQDRVAELIARGRTARALQFLDHVICNRQMELFRSSRAVSLDRRMAWMYRVELLRSLGRIHEALAWTLLECELHPRNGTAAALRESLKLDMLPPPQAGLLADGLDSTPDPSVPDRWHGVAGMRELKVILERDVVLPFQQPELYEHYKLDLPNGILLYGPPGCGKTFIARALARVLDIAFIEIKPSDFGCTYIHGSQMKIAEIFDKARSADPTLLFLDELDSICPRRDHNLYHAYASEVNEMLTQLNDCGRDRVLVVAATNRLDKIDPAVLRPGRFDKKILVGPPDLEARVEMLRLHLADRPHAGLDFLRLGRETEDYTCAELAHVAAESARRALQRGRAIVEEDVMAALAVHPPAAFTEATTPAPDDEGDGGPELEMQLE